MLFGVSVVLYVYAIVGIIAFVVSIMTKKFFKGRLKPKDNIFCKNLASARLFNVVKIVFLTYFIPLILVVSSLAYYAKFTGLIIMGILFSSGIVAEKIIIPADTKLVKKFLETKS